MLPVRFKTYRVTNRIKVSIISYNQSLCTINIVHPAKLNAHFASSNSHLHYNYLKRSVLGYLLKGPMMLLPNSMLACPSSIAHQ